MNSKQKNFVEGMVSFENPAYTVSLLPRKGSGVVRIEGAIHAGPWHADVEQESAAIIASSLLDEGTTKHSRESYRLALEAVGAQVSFWAAGKYLFFSILATSKALPDALSLTFEALTSPLLSEISFTEVVDREAATRLHEVEDTRVQSQSALSRLLFAPGSAGYSVSPEQEREEILKLTREQVLQFVSEAYRGRAVLAVVGDIEAGELEKMLSSNLKHWNNAPGKSARGVSALESPGAPRKAFVSIAGKESTDVYMGSALRITPSDPTFPALMVAVDMLGGGFSDHLMQTIRDRDGLTYGTLARIYRRENQAGLLWSVWAMFGNSLYEKGMKALKKEIGVFLEKGITEKRLKEKVEEIEGRTAVFFSEPRAAVREMRAGMLSVGDAADAAQFVEKARTLTTKDVQHAAEKHIRVDAVAAAGAISE